MPYNHPLTNIPSEFIKKLIPHRPPFLFIDEVRNFVKDQGGTGICCFQADSPFLTGHFPGRPIVPAVLTIEAIAQTAAIVFSYSELLSCVPYDKIDEKLKDIKMLPGEGVLVRVDSFKFAKPMFPGQKIHLEVKCLKKHQSLIKLEGVAKVQSNKCAWGELTIWVSTPPTN